MMSFANEEYTARMYIFKYKIVVSNVAVTWHSQETRLTIHYENGFTLTDARSGIDPSGKSQILWSFPFDRLKMSADDGQRLLWLDFGGDEGEQVSDSTYQSIWQTLIWYKFICLRAYLTVNIFKGLEPAATWKSVFSF